MRMCHATNKFYPQIICYQITKLCFKYNNIILNLKNSIMPINNYNNIIITRMI